MSQYDQWAEIEECKAIMDKVIKGHTIIEEVSKDFEPFRYAIESMKKNKGSLSFFEFLLSKKRKIHSRQNLISFRYRNILIIISEKNIDNIF